MLSWTTILLRDGLKKMEILPVGDVKMLCDTQALLFFSICAGGTAKHREKGLRQLIMIWSSVPAVHSVILNSISSLDANEHFLVYSAHYVQYLYQKKTTEDIPKMKVELLDALVKICVSCKKKPEPFILQSCRGLLSIVTHDEFSNIILPALEKAMLRSPEVALQSVGLLLAGLSLDLSQYAMAIGKQLISE